MGQFDIVIIGQSGRIETEALLLAASLRAHAPGFAGRLIVAEPQPGPLWHEDPRMSAQTRAMLRDLGAEILPFENRHFGSAYPHGNKIEALAALPAAPFLFLDSDTLILGDIGALPINSVAPAASMRREGTWPVPTPGWLGYSESWRSLYDRFGLDFESSLDPSQPEECWKRHLYFNAGWFCGPDAQAFGARFRAFAVAIRDDPPAQVAQQPFTPWLDQVALPLVIHSLGGGRPGHDLDGLDGAITCHYRSFPLLYARESDAVVAALERVAAPNRLKTLLKRHAPLRRMVYQGRGAKARALFDRAALPAQEKQIRTILRAHGFWMR
ncbi:hypothetical protein [Limimaricola hongkongensis]|uniref:Uncharacterized protein n=1 Tax=Limimaricola hongkongensis DSM 17492 TaxID=1122180 RepID=A0A017H9E0_9RHOB|nr:hypothetical protein [Limimaricola hongkongensis]EYD70986.1 hypothetical protein Lokhon_02630 [Limimaricola hongkongensis DSM 17492]